MCYEILPFMVIGIKYLADVAPLFENMKII